MSAHAIQTSDLAKAFPGGVVAVSGLDLQVEYGSVFGFIGRNGAGKTTTLRLLMGLLRPSHGSARVLETDLAAAPRTVRARVAYVSQSVQLPGWMTVPELVRYAAHFYDEWDADLARDLTKRWDLPTNRAVGQLSSGEQRKAAIVLALAPRPEVLLLDEPAAGLDPIARREFLDELIAVLGQRDGCTVLLSTHNISDLERLAEHIGIIDRGRLVLSARLDELQASTRRVQVIFPGDSVPVGFNLPGANRVEVSGPVARAITRATDPVYLDALRRKPGVRVDTFPVGLEELFIELVGHRPAEGQAGKADNL
ncbi:MAG: ABC transporter ATP-binding protein [Verrucomicrobia bacterium]|nr:ABC transporter ATP-binding protein [Verrucomicrobiota bacterium]